MKKTREIKTLLPARRCNYLQKEEEKIALKNKQQFRVSVTQPFPNFTKNFMKWFG